jgi:protein O-GlcNAc transferase
VTDPTLIDQADEHQRLGRFSEAADLYRDALARDPENPVLHTNLAHILQTQGLLDQAIASYQRAITLDPDLHAAWYALGCAWSARKEDALSLDCFKKSILACPDHGPSHHNLGKALFRLGLIDEALTHFRSAAALGSDLRPLTAIATTIPGSPSADHIAILHARKEWVKNHLPPPDPSYKFIPPTANHRPIRIGYISSFFHQQNWMKPVWGLINHHDRQKVQIFYFPMRPSQNAPAIRNMLTMNSTTSQLSRTAPRQKQSTDAK